MIAIVGFLTLFIIVFLLMRGKSMPIAIFATIPIIAAIILGNSPKEIGELINSGLNSVWKTAVLFIFSVIYFGVMSDVGMFDIFVDKLISKAGNNVILLAISTSIIAILGHLDGATATTCLITIPAMLPLYKKMNMRREMMLLIIGVAMGIMNLVPWGGPIVRVATVLKMDVTELWHQILPFQILCILITISIAAICGVIEKRRLSKITSCGASNIVTPEINEKVDIDDSLKKPKLTWFNLLLTFVLIICLVFAILPSHILFMVALAIALIVNYPNMKEQRTRFKAHAGDALDMSATLLAAGVFIGVMNKTGMLDAMVKVILGFMPEALGRYMNLIAGVFSLPIGAMLGADTFYYGLFPILGEVGKNFGVQPVDIGIGMLIGKNVGMIVSPLQPTTFLACGLAGLELKDHIKFSFKWLWFISIIMVIFAVLIGLMKIY
ncbi:CitMHS family transporter [Fusobacterium sp. PH5-44]|uniref:CitMHS family transporter n=1 Tax=unclassified Fusobacterium TaxID=2648384 RepID=UPI003D22CAE5